MHLSPTLVFLIICLVGVGVAVLVYFFWNITKANSSPLELNTSETESGNLDESLEIMEGSKVTNVLEEFDTLELARKMYKVWVQERIYMQQGLTVKEFGKKLGVEARIVGQILNSLYGHTFKELTGMYRVEYAKQRIEEGFLDEYTLEALGMESGFSSRTTFFNVFKKEIGICPSEYWKNYLAEVRVK